jgi:hypothetical protein
MDSFWLAMIGGGIAGGLAVLLLVAVASQVLPKVQYNSAALP